MSLAQPVLVTRADHEAIAHVTLDSPANRNALSRALVAQLREHLETAGRDQEVKAVLLTSSQRVFCSGADLKEAATVDMVESARGLIALQRAVAVAEVPVVIRLDGPVRAGGLGLVASADIVLAATDVTLALTEVRLGLAAAVISIALENRLPTGVAADWFLTGRTIDAAAARQGGLLTQVAAPADLGAATEAVLADLRAGERQGLVAAKRLLNRRLVAQFDERGEELAQLSGTLFHSPVAQAAMARFRAGR